MRALGAGLICVAGLLIAVGWVQGIRHIREAPFDYGAPWLIVGLVVGEIGNALL